MSVTQRNIPSGGEGYTFFDIDGTYTFEDTGHLTFLEAGKTTEDFEQTMRKTHLPDRNEPAEGKGNELAITLDQMSSDEVQEMAEAAENIEVSYRPGVHSLLEGLDENDSPAIAHSAGWEVPIKAVTNGYFDDKLAARVEGEQLDLNGRYQKPVKIQNYMIEQGIEDPVEDPVAYANFIGDSNTDSEAIKYADATGGLGVSIDDSLDDAMDVEEATVYFGDQTGEHDLAAAVVYHHNVQETDATAEFIDEYDLDVSSGEAEVGELAYQHRRQDYVQSLIDEVRQLQ